MFFSGSMVTSPSWTVTLFLHSPNEATSHLMICIQSISGRFGRTFQAAKRSRLGSFPGKLSTIQYTILSAHCNTITYTGRSSCNLAIIADPDYVRRGSAHPYCPIEMCPTSNDQPIYQLQICWQPPQVLSVYVTLRLPFAGRRNRLHGR